MTEGFARSPLTTAVGKEHRSRNAGKTKHESINAKASREGGY